VTLAAYGGVQYLQFAFSTPATHLDRSDSGIGQRSARIWSRSTSGIWCSQVFGHNIRGTVDLTPSDWKT
jgi:hypothetical protein